VHKRKASTIREPSMAVKALVTELAWPITRCQIIVDATCFHQPESCLIDRVASPRCSSLISAHSLIGSRSRWHRQCRRTLLRARALRDKPCSAERSFFKAARSRLFA